MDLLSSFYTELTSPIEPNPSHDDIPTNPPQSTSSGPPQRPTPHEISADDLKSLGAQTLDEWESSRAKESSASATATRNPVKHTFAPASSNGSGIGTSVAVPIGGARSSEHVKQLNELCQVRGLVPEYEFSQMGQRWKAVLKVAGHVVEAEGTFASKMEGKEVCAREGCVIVGGMAVRGDAVGEGGEGGLKRLQEENWVGMLLEYCNATSNPHPVYQDYQIGLQSFAITVSLRSHTPPAPLFGSPSNPYNSKKTAKAAASMDAVIWLRSQGLLADKGGPIRKKARKSDASTLLNSTGNSNSASQPTTPRRRSSGLGGSPGAPEICYVDEVNKLCDDLGLKPPMYQLEPQQGTSLYSGAARFDMSVNVKGLYGLVGEVSNVFGRKNAREECAKGVWKALKKVLEARMEEAGL